MSSFWQNGCCLCKTWSLCFAPWYPVEAVGENIPGLGELKLAVDLFHCQWKNIVVFYLLNHFFTFCLFPVQIQGCSCAVGGSLGFLADAVTGAGVGARGLPCFRTEFVSMVADESWSSLRPPALCAGVWVESRETGGEERPNHRSNKKLRSSKIFHRPGKVICQNWKVGDGRHWDLLPNPLSFSSVLPVGLHFFLLGFLSIWVLGPFVTFMLVLVWGLFVF